jgi:hypothetical protein
VETKKLHIELVLTATSEPPAIHVDARLRTEEEGG